MKIVHKHCVNVYRFGFSLWTLQRCGVQCNLYFCCLFLRCGYKQRKLYSFRPYIQCSLRINVLISRHLFLSISPFWYIPFCFLSVAFTVGCTLYNWPQMHGAQESEIVFVCGQKCVVVEKKYFLIADPMSLMWFLHSKRDKAKIAIVRC